MQPGRVLSDKYRLETLLGRGGMGSVWRAEHLGFRAPVAVKLMDYAVGLDPDALARFHREAHSAATIRSPHVVQILDHGVDDASNMPFIVMELLDGETLGDRLARERTLSPERTASVIGDVCRALGRAHPAGIVHRDLKPDNVFLVRDEREFAKVLDFGVAKSRPYALGVGETTRTGSLVGTPYYMSPEQMRGAKELDSRSDLWSVAVMACECITGRRPFEGATVGGLALAICSGPVPRASELGTVTPAFEAWLARALERDPARRFQTARDLSDALTLACTGAGSQAVAAELPSSSPRPAPVVAPPALANTFGAQTSAVSPKRRARARRFALAVVGVAATGAWLAWRALEPAAPPEPAVLAAEAELPSRAAVPTSTPTRAAPAVPELTAAPRAVLGTAPAADPAPGSSPAAATAPPASPATESATAPRSPARGAPPPKRRSSEATPPSAARARANDPRAPSTEPPPPASRPPASTSRPRPISLDEVLEGGR